MQQKRDNSPYCLYRITNTLDSKFYVGVTKSPSTRRYQHLVENRRNSNPKLKAAVNKYGKDNFVFDILCWGDIDYIYDLERMFIEETGAIEKGYNLAPGGRGGDGKKISKRKDDYFCYVSGFWFPNKRLACEKIGITPNIFYNRRRGGTLGDVDVKVRGIVSGHPVYFKGIWFPNADVAADVYSKTRPAILQSIKNGKIEEDARLTVRHPKRVYKIHGEVYESMKQAAESLKTKEITIQSRYSTSCEGYEYEYMITESNKCQTN